MEDRVLSRAALLVAALLASLALVACGGDDEGEQGSESAAPPDEVTKSFLVAIASGDGEAACSHASAAAVEDIEAQGTCEEVVTEQIGEVDQQDVEETENATFTVTEETDATATVEAEKESGTTETFDLVLEDGEWKIAG